MNLYVIHYYYYKIVFRLQLEFGVCIDFTASNGPVHSSQSLHYLAGRTPNQYELAITSVLEICQHYNHTKEFDAMGFGAKIPPNFQVSHLFPLVSLSLSFYCEWRLLCCHVQDYSQLKLIIRSLFRMWKHLKEEFKVYKEFFKHTDKPWLKPSFMVQPTSRILSKNLHTKLRWCVKMVLNIKYCWLSPMELSLTWPEL